MTDPIAPDALREAEVERLTRIVNGYERTPWEKAAHDALTKAQDAQDRIARALAVLDDAGSWGAQDGLVQRSDLRAILTGTDD